MAKLTGRQYLMVKVDVTIKNISQGSKMWLVSLPYTAGNSGHRVVSLPYTAGNSGHTTVGDIMEPNGTPMAAYLMHIVKIWFSGFKTTHELEPKAFWKNFVRTSL